MASAFLLRPLCFATVSCPKSVTLNPRSLSSCSDLGRLWEASLLELASRPGMLSVFYCLVILGDLGMQEKKIILSRRRVEIEDVDVV